MRILGWGLIAIGVVSSAFLMGMGTAAVSTAEATRESTIVADLVQPDSMIWPGEGIQATAVAAKDEAAQMECSVEVGENATGILELYGIRCWSLASNPPQTVCKDHDQGGDEIRAKVAPAYSRELYRHWSDEDGDRMNTRHEVLAAESRRPVATNRNASKVLGGAWVCPYTLEGFGDPSKLDVDHLVPLKEAHISGGWEWDSEKRERYANDLSDPDHLVAAKASANRAKGAKDPAQWMPDENHCGYAIAWIRTKERWALEYDPEELKALLEAIATCPPAYG